MRGIVLIDFESFSGGLKASIGDFRGNLPEQTRVFWTITRDDNQSLPAAKDGFIKDRDRIFIKPEIDSGLKTAYDQANAPIIPALQAAGITEAFVGGATHYGCVLGAALHMQEAGINVSIMRGLTDYDELLPEDHAEGMPSLRKANIPLISQEDALRLLTGPNNRAPGFNF